MDGKQMDRNAHRLDKFKQNLIDAANDLKNCVDEELDNIFEAIDTERDRINEECKQSDIKTEEKESSNLRNVSLKDKFDGNHTGDLKKSDHEDNGETNETVNKQKKRKKEVDNAPLKLKLQMCKSAKMLRLRELLVTPTSINFELVNTFTVAEKCAVLAVERRHVWVAYHEGGNTSLEEYDFGGNLKYSKDVKDQVRRITCDGRGNVYMTCREAHCIKTVNASADTLTTILNIEGYPNGIFYDNVQNRILFSENRSASYYVYESGEWIKIQSMNLQSGEAETIMTEKEFDLGYVGSIALNVNGDICIAEYIHDKACIGTTDGQMKAVCKEDNTIEKGQVLNPYEIRCDHNGLIFIACTASKAVYVLSEKGEIIDRLLLDFIPNSVSVNDKGFLCIASMDSNNVLVYTYERRYCNP